MISMSFVEGFFGACAVGMGSILMLALIGFIVLVVVVIV
jgi:hypothetical protein